MGRIIGIVALGLGLAACGGLTGFVDDIVGSGTPTSEQRDVGSFDAVRLEGVGDVEISIGDERSLTIETDDNLVDRVETSVRAGTLVIGIEDGITIAPRSGLTITVTTPDLTLVEITGAGTVSVGPIATDSLAVDVLGAGSVRVDDLAADTLTVTLGGAGNIEVAGDVDREVVDLSGVGNYDGGDLRALDVQVTADGAGNVEVWAVETLDVSASGVGSVSYWGDPATLISATGVGSVEPLGDR
jgi:hypothetical protein